MYLEVWKHGRNISGTERKTKQLSHFNNRKKKKRKKKKRPSREEMRLPAGCGLFGLNQKTVRCLFLLRREITEKISLLSPDGRENEE